MHRDHGWEDGWSSPSFTTEDVETELTNGELLPVVFSVNCASGFFDNETADGDYGTVSDEVYFAEALLRNADGGAIGILGDTRNSPTWANNALTRGYFDAIWPDTLPGYGDNSRQRRLGDILNYGKIYMLSQVGVSGTTPAVTQALATNELYLWHVIGDPTLEMWTARPLTRLDLLSILLEQSNTLSRVQYQVEGAIVTAYQETPGGVVPLGRSTVENGEAMIEYVQQPQAGVPVQFAVSKPGSISPSG